MFGESAASGNLYDFPVKVALLHDDLNDDYKNL